MEIVLTVLIVAGLVWMRSIHADLAKLEEREARHWDELDRAIQQLREDSLSVADRKALDAVHDVLFRQRLNQVVRDAVVDEHQP